MSQTFGGLELLQGAPIEKHNVGDRRYAFSYKFNEVLVDSIISLGDVKLEHHSRLMTLVHGVNYLMSRDGRIKNLSTWDKTFMGRANQRIQERFEPINRTLLKIL